MADKDNSNPFLDMFQDFGKNLNIPGPDMNDIMEYHRKNLQALQAATQVGSSSAQALMAKQREVLEEALAEITETVQNASKGGSPTDMAQAPMELARKAFERTLQNTQDMAEIVRQGNEDAFEVLRARMMESIEDLTGKK